MNALRDSKPQGAGQGKPCASELEDLFQASPFGEVRQLLQHFFNVHPRNEDLDISANVGGDGAQPTGRVSVPVFDAADSTTIKRVRIKAKRGLVLYIGGVGVKRADGSLDLSTTEVTVQKAGVPIAWVPATTFERRVVLDRDDTLEIAIKNTSADTLLYEYAVTGFARRAGIPVMQPVYGGGQS